MSSVGVHWTHPDYKKLKWKEWYSKNKDKKDEYDSRYRITHAAERKRRQEKWLSKHPHYSRNRARLARALNPEKLNRRQREWRKRNRDRVREYNAVWRATSDAHRTGNKRYRSTERGRLKHRIHQNIRRTRIALNGGSFTIDQWNQILERFNHRCAYCKVGNIKLEQDHILPIKLGGTSDVSNIQPLCKPCNIRKGAKAPVSGRENYNRRR